MLYAHLSDSHMLSPDLYKSWYHSNSEWYQADNMAIDNNFIISVVRLGMSDVFITILLCVGTVNILLLQLYNWIIPAPLPSFKKRWCRFGIRWFVVVQMKKNRLRRCHVLKILTQPVYAHRSLATEHKAGGQEGVFACFAGTCRDTCLQKHRK